MLLQGIYKLWVKQVRMNIDRAYNENVSIYENEDFVKIFDRGNRLSIFNTNMLSEQVLRAFHGKWSGSVGESKDGNRFLGCHSKPPFVEMLLHKLIALFFEQ